MGDKNMPLIVSADKLRKVYDLKIDGLELVLLIKALDIILRDMYEIKLGLEADGEVDMLNTLRLCFMERLQ